MDQKTKEQMCDRIIESNENQYRGNLIGGFVSILIGNETSKANTCIIIDESGRWTKTKKSNKRDNRLKWNQDDAVHKAHMQELQ